MRRQVFWKLASFWPPLINKCTRKHDTPAYVLEGPNSRTTGTARPLISQTRHAASSGKDARIDAISIKVATGEERRQVPSAALVGRAKGVSGRWRLGPVAPVGRSRQGRGTPAATVAEKTAAG